MRKTPSFPLLAFALAALLPLPAAAFEFTFSWGDIPLCTSGRPNVVPSPRFVLRDVPEGTRVIRFKLVDLDAPAYPHGGGIVPWRGRAEIAPGAFTYNSPCPPRGRHRYQWQATALDGPKGNILATARAMRLYP